jgi:NhaP-type Na+/H+ or K+/H+ antiporter
MLLIYAGANIDPNLLLAVFLPALLFESSFSMEVHQIKVSFLYLLVLVICVLVIGNLENFFGTSKK